MPRDLILPSRKKRWVPGSVQLGLFIRLADGSRMEAGIDSASEPLAAQASKLLLAMCQKDASAQTGALESRLDGVRDPK